MGDVMSFPDTFEEFAEQYKIVDKQQIYTNGTEMIPIFRVKQWLYERPTADVVPKSEVEELQSEIEELQAKVAKLRKENIELLVSKETDILISMEKLVTVRTEHPIVKAIEEKAAREIFEEIEAIKCVGLLPSSWVKLFAELKKKYTEQKQCPNCRYFVGCEKAIWTGVCEEYAEVKNDK